MTRSFFSCQRSLVILVIALFTSSLFAGMRGAAPKSNTPPKPPALSTTIELSEEAKGEGTLTLRVEVPDNHHVFGPPSFKIMVSEARGVALGSWQFAEAAGRNEDFEQDYYHHEVVATATVSWESNAYLALKVTRQACSESPMVCFLPATDVFTVDLGTGTGSDDALVMGSEGNGAQAGADVKSLPTIHFFDAKGNFEDNKTVNGFLKADKFIERMEGKEDTGIVAWFQDFIANGKEKNIALILLITFIGGVLSSMTPCVYPVIPLTVNFIGARSKGRMNGFQLTLVYVLGMALIYGILGLAAVQTGALFGAWAQGKVAITVICLVLLALALSLLGFYELTLPGFIQKRMDKARMGQGGKGYFGAFLVGGLSGLVVSPCVGPILFALLTFVGTLQSLAKGFAVMFTFGLGLGVLFIVVGTFSASIPRSGTWMLFVKDLFGWLTLAAVFFLAKANVPTPFYVLFMVVAGAALIVLYFGHLPTRPPTGPMFRGMGLLATVMVMLVAFQFRFAATPAPKAGTQLVWRTDFVAALAEAKETGKPVMVDYYADWCVACHELEKFTFNDPEVAARLQEYILIKVDMTTAEGVSDAS